jgi:hypothetical protein
VTYRTMYDSTDVMDIPANARMVAGYVDGRYANVRAMRARFRDAKVVTITVFGKAGADVGDIEPGCMTVDHGVRWARAEVAAGRKPTLYCMASMWPQVKAAVKAAGIGRKVSYWVASYDDVSTIPAGAVAKQYRHGDLSTIGPKAYSGGHFDVSSVVAYWPGVDPRPPLSERSRLLARKLRRRLSRRRYPVGAGRRLLRRLRRAIRHALHG